jgi:hypothetical protein
MPLQDLNGLGKRQRRRVNTQRITLGEALRLALKHSGDARGADNELRHQHKAFNGHRHLPLNPEFMQVHGIHRQVVPVGKLAHHMRGGAIVGHDSVARQTVAVARRRCNRAGHS